LLEHDEIFDKNRLANILGILGVIGDDAHVFRALARAPERSDAIFRNLTYRLEDKTQDKSIHYGAFSKYYIFALSNPSSSIAILTLERLSDRHRKNVHEKKL
jgi:hypothetical protein